MSRPAFVSYVWNEQRIGTLLALAGCIIMGVAGSAQESPPTSPAAIPVPRELVESALNAQQELNTWAAIARYTSSRIELFCTKRGMAVRRDGLWCDPVVKESK